MPRDQEWRRYLDARQKKAVGARSLAIGSPDKGILDGIRQRPLARMHRQAQPGSRTVLVMG